MYEMNDKSHDSVVEAIVEKYVLVHLFFLKQCIFFFFKFREDC